MSNLPNPMVTIGIPTYNRADGYLGQAIRSALNQKYSNMEVIISDNCSSDGTETLVREFSDPRIRYHRHDTNIGANNNFNFLLKQARGEYFLLLHDDDLIDRDFVEVCIKAANKATHFGIIRTGTRVIDAQGKILHEYQNRVVGVSLEDYYLGWFKHKTAWYLCSTLFNTRRLKEIGGFQSKHDLLPDGVAIAKLTATYPRIDVEDVKASFRKHAGEITFAVGVIKWVEDFLSLLELICKLVPEKNAMLRSEGERFFSQLSYNRVRAIESSLKRFFVYVTVFKRFHYRYLPPPVRRLVFQNPVSRVIRRKREAI